METNYAVAIALFVVAMVLGLLVFAVLPAPNQPILTGETTIITKDNFAITFNTNEGFDVQNLDPNETVSFLVTDGALNGTANLYATTIGGQITITPSTTGVLSITADNPNFHLLINNVASPPQFSFQNGKAFDVYWSYYG
jgi:hypothetical protein